MRVRVVEGTSTKSGADDVDARDGLCESTDLRIDCHSYFVRFDSPFGSWVSVRAMTIRMQ